MNFIISKYTNSFLILVFRVIKKIKTQMHLVSYHLIEQFSINKLIYTYSIFQELIN